MKGLYILELMFMDIPQTGEKVLTSFTLQFALCCLIWRVSHNAGSEALGMETMFRMDASHPSDKRGRQAEIPFGYEALLTEEQRHRIDVCRSFGWELHFIRRPLFMSPTVVMVDSDNSRTWQINDDGELELFTETRGS